MWSHTRVECVRLVVDLADETQLRLFWKLLSRRWFYGQRCVQIGVIINHERASVPKLPKVVLLFFLLITYMHLDTLLYTSVDVVTDILSDCLSLCVNLSMVTCL